MALALIITYKGWYAIKQRNQTKPNHHIYSRLTVCKQMTDVNSNC